MEELEILKHVATWGLAGMIILSFMFGAFRLFQNIAKEYFVQNRQNQENNLKTQENNIKIQEYNLKMAEGINEMNKHINSGNIYFKEKLQEIKTHVSTLATFEQVDNLQKNVEVIFEKQKILDIILEKFEDLESKL